MRNRLGRALRKVRCAAEGYAVPLVSGPTVPRGVPSSSVGESETHASLQLRREKDEARTSARRFTSVSLRLCVSVLWCIKSRQPTASLYVNLENRRHQESPNSDMHPPNTPQTTVSPYKIISENTRLAEMRFWQVPSINRLQTPTKLVLNRDFSFQLIYPGAVRRSPTTATGLND